VGLRTIVKVNFSWLTKLDTAAVEETEPVSTERVEVKEAFKVAN
jgi:hypothetical protein